MQICLLQCKTEAYLAPSRLDRISVAVARVHICPSGSQGRRKIPSGHDWNPSGLHLYLKKSTQPT